MSADGYTAFQGQLRADIANTRRLLDLLERWGGPMAPYVPRSIKLDADIDSARTFMRGLEVILMMQVATPEERAAYLPGETVIESEPVAVTGRRFSDALKGATNRKGTR